MFGGEVWGGVGVCACVEEGARRGEVAGAGGESEGGGEEETACFGGWGGGEAGVVGGEGGEVLVLVVGRLEGCVVEVGDEVC